MKVKRQHPLVDMIKLTWEEAKGRFPASQPFKGCVEYQNTGFYSEDDFDKTLLSEDVFSDHGGYLYLLGPFPDGGFYLADEESLANQYELVPQVAPESDLFLISGRVSGDDDDSVHIVEAQNQGVANSVFTKHLQNECGGDEATDVFIIDSSPLPSAISQRLNRNSGLEESLSPTVSDKDLGVLLAALRHLEDAVVAGENLTKLQDIVDIDYLQGFDISGLCESINIAEKPQKLSFQALNNGENPEGIVLEVEQLGDPGVYQEIGVSAINGSECVAFAVVGLDPNNEVRVSLTTDGNGYGDQPLSIYPCRPIEQCIESDG